ncbi:PRTRC system ParB family protein [Sphingobium sp. LB126]|uniref:PRTRC system ParB family protein n=1 Tax=Sphingobium sp. LB126 TaxID=1983755 RepID=UPI001F5C013D|nr:PRTRC system ParB family protein [Sphingobium sp. LB126]
MDTQQNEFPTILPLSKIVKGDNPRRYFDKQKHAELVVSLQLRGLIQPILLRPAGDLIDSYSIVVGERRWRAALEAFGRDGEIPVLIREMTDQEALDAAIAENEDRDDPSETEQADAAVRYLAACQGDRAEAARRLGWSRAKFDRRMALAELSDPVKLALDERRIKVGHAELLAAIPADKQEKALDTILTANLDVNKTRELLARVTQSLASACFDKAECLACPFNSSTQRVLFETHVDDGNCTNPTCFQLKTEAVEQARREELQRAADAAQVDIAAASDDMDDGDEDDDLDVDDVVGVIVSAESAEQPGDPASVPAQTTTGVATSKPATVASSDTGAQKSTVSARSLARRTAELREAMWRTALARALAGNAERAHTTILVAAMSGTLSQIKADTLTSRSSLLVGASFPDMNYSSQIAEIRALAPRQAEIILSVIGAAYAKDVAAFEHVADLARTFDVDLRDIWHVDQPFLDRYTKEELKFIAMECGLIVHMGEKAFARLLAAKKTDLILGMLNATGFVWAGRLPSCMTLDGNYGPPPARTLPDADAPATAIAA